MFERKILTVRRELSYFAKLTNIRESKKFYWKIKFNFLLSGDLLAFIHLDSELFLSVLLHGTVDAFSSFKGR